MSELNITICISVPLLLLGIGMFVGNIFFTLRAERTTGIIVDYEARRTSRGGSSFAEVVDFQGPDGKTIRFVEKSSRSRFIFKTGHSVEVYAELRGIKELLKMDKKWEFFINLSAQDFPLKSQAYIHNYLSRHIGKDFLKVLNQFKMRPDTMHRVEDIFTEFGDEIISEPIVKRPFLRGVTPYIGNQWMILSRKFCEFVSYNPEVERFKEFYKNTLIADEGFFQTVIMNTSYKANIVNDDKRTIDWIPMGTIKLRPRDFTIQDASLLTSNQDLFARKFDETIDSDILSLLERHLLPKPVRIDKPEFAYSASESIAV